MNIDDLDISIIIAIYERQDELKDLLLSLTKQTDSSFEVIVVDDGSKNKLESVCKKFERKLNIHYYFKENSGPGKSRNFGVEKSMGNYYIFLDSDTIVPPHYIASVKEELAFKYVDAFGGPDGSDNSFSYLQKAITFSMTSFITTGGIRGGKKQIGTFQPRSFNMGLSSFAFQKTGGFSDLRIGEDPDLSMTLWEKGFRTRLFQKSKVIHKRRSSLKKFARQVYQFGIARPILNKRHPNYIKLTFWFPSLFVIGTILSFILLISSFKFIENKFVLQIPFMVWLFYMFFIFATSTLKFKSPIVGLLSVLTTLIQFFFYGFGFLESQFKLNILKKNSKIAFPDHFI